MTDDEMRDLRGSDIGGQGAPMSGSGLMRERLAAAKSVQGLLLDAEWTLDELIGSLSHDGIVLVDEQRLAEALHEFGIDQMADCAEPATHAIIEALRHTPPTKPRDANTLRERHRPVPRMVAVDEDGMCPNCVTPWKCNGPHDPEQRQDGEMCSLDGDRWPCDGYRADTAEALLANEREAHREYIEIRDPDDEIVGYGAWHIERMDDDDVWTGLYTEDGGSVMVDFIYAKGKKVAMVVNDERDHPLTPPPPRTTAEAIIAAEKRGAEQAEALLHEAVADIEAVNQAHLRDHGDEVADADSCETCAELAGIYESGRYDAKYRRSSDIPESEQPQPVVVGHVPPFDTIQDEGRRP